MVPPRAQEARGYCYCYRHSYDFTAALLLLPLLLLLPPPPTTTPFPITTLTATYGCERRKRESGPYKDTGFVLPLKCKMSKADADKPFRFYYHHFYYHHLPSLPFNR